MGLGVTAAVLLFTLQDDNKNTALFYRSNQSKAAATAETNSGVAGKTSTLDNVESEHAQGNSAGSIPSKVEKETENQETKSSTMTTTATTNTITSEHIKEEEELDEFTKLARSSSSSLQKYASVPSFLFHMHIPKTGGRTFTELIRRFINKLPGSVCSMDLCCTPWAHYMNSLQSTTTLRPDPNNICRSFSREITVSGILETRRQLFNTTSLNMWDDDGQNWWYTATTFHNPIAKFVSVARHALRYGRCNWGDKRFAVYAKLNGKCQAHGHDREQAQYFYRMRMPFDPSLENDNSTAESNDKNVDIWVPPNTSAVSDPWLHVSAFDFVGITDYMDASACLLALETDAVHYTISHEAALNACRNVSSVHIQSTSETEVAPDPLTTKQVFKILKHHHPVDLQIYPKVLGQFRDKLSQALAEHTDFAPRFKDDLGAITLEHAIWSKVAKWFRDYEQDDDTLFQLLDGMSNKDILAPGLGWGGSEGVRRRYW